MSDGNQNKLPPVQSLGQAPGLQQGEGDPDSTHGPIRSNIAASPSGVTHTRNLVTTPLPGVDQAGTPLQGKASGVTTGLPEVADGTKGRTLRNPIDPFESPQSTKGASGQPLDKDQSAAKNSLDPKKKDKVQESDSNSWETDSETNKPSKMSAADREALVKAVGNLNETLAKTLQQEPLNNFNKKQAGKPKLSPLNTGNSKEDQDRPDKMDLYLRAVFLKLGEIDTVNERFHADAFIQARWREPRLDGQGRGEEFELLQQDGFWDPKLYIENAMGDLKESLWHIVSYNSLGEATVYQRRRVKGTFFERMELNQFPFDTQDLTLTVSTERGELEIDLQPDTSEISTVNVQSFVDEQEWNLHKHINTWTKVTTNAYKSSRHKHPAISISCTATRRSPFFVWNIILVMMFICSLIFTTFTVDQDKPENRIQLSFILLLSNITFKFTVNQTLPKVSYLTYLDKYILISMAILCLVCIWHAIVGQLAERISLDYAEKADRIAFGALIVIYFFFNFIFFVWTKYLVYRRSQEYRLRDQKQREKLKEMEQKSPSKITQVVPQNP